MPITGTGWEFHVERLGIHKLGAQTRTYGAYQAFLDGQPIAALSGNVCESPGPSENDHPASVTDPRRVLQGNYPLSTQFGQHFVTIGFTTVHPEQHPMPGVLLTDAVEKGLRRSPNSDSGESADHGFGGGDDGASGRAMEFILPISAR